MLPRKNSKLIFTIALLLLLSFALFAQSQRELVPQSNLRTAIDALGREVTITAPIDRIMVVGRAAVMPADALFMFPAVDNMEILLAKTDQGLGDFFSLIRSGFEQRLGQNVGAEEIIAHNPSLVITKSNNYDSVVTLLEPFNIPVFVMDLETPQAWKDEIVQLGKLLNDNETPQRIRRAFEKREVAVATKIATLAESEKPSILMMQATDTDGVTAFSVAPNTWIQTTLIEQAGGKPVWVDSKLGSNSWRKVSFEQIATWDPSKIILISYKTPASEFISTIKKNPQWQEMHAIKNNNLYSAPADVMSYMQSDSRWILALQWLAAELHPQLFPNFTMENEIREFYKDFYRLTDETILTHLIAAYRATTLQE